MAGQAQATQSTRVRRAWRPYVAISLLVAAIALAGFWPKYFSKMAVLAPDSPWYIHLHAAVFSGWIAILFTQSWLAANGKLRLHRRLGAWFFAYGLVVILVAWLTAFQVFWGRMAEGDYAVARNGLYVPFTDLLYFAPVLLAAWIYRTRPEIHKRLIVVATTVLLIAGAHRFIGNYVGAPPSIPLVLLLWLSPIFLGMAFDWIRSRRVHAVYLIGIAVVLAMKFRPRWQESEPWDAFTSLLV
jgi:hypothetical protein